MIDSILENLGWNIDESSPECNVFTERAKTRSQAKLLKGKQPDYVLYEPSTDRAVAIIEAKRMGQTLSEALEQAVTNYANPLDVNIVFACDGGLIESFDKRSGGPLMLDGEPITNFLPVNSLLKFAKEGPNLSTPTRTQQTKQELIKVFAQANDLLRKEGLREGIERFTEFSNLLFLKLISEIETEKEHRGEGRQLEARYCWEAFSEKPAKEMLDYINDTVLRRFVQSYNHSGDVFQKQILIKNAHTLKNIVDRLSELHLLNTESDIKGDAFEYFLKHSVTVGNDLGEYFTPRHIVKLIVELIDPRFQETVYDPCCGTGGFLIEAFRHISEKVKKTDATKYTLEKETVYGRELTGTARIAKLNMILAGDGHTNIRQMDSLESPVKDKYSIVLTNFPFSQYTDYGHLYGFDTDSANPIFLKHAIDACEDGGRIGVVVPEGLLFDESRSCTKIRRIMTETCKIEAIIALHNFVFRPYTGQPTSILILTKGTPTSKVWFFDADTDGFEKTGSQRGRRTVSGENQLLNLRRIWSAKPETDSSFWIDIDTIRKTNYKLSLNSYKQKENRPDWVSLGGENGVCDIRIGGTPKTTIKDYYGNKYLWVTITDMKKSKYIMETNKMLSDSGVQNSNVKLLPKGTVLLSFKLTIGKVAIAGKDLYTNEAIAGLIPKSNKVLPMYLYYILPAIDLDAYTQRAAKGKTLNRKILQSIKIPVPPLEEQKAFIKEMEEREAKVMKLYEQVKESERSFRDSARTYLAERRQTNSEL